MAADTPAQRPDVAGDPAPSPGRGVARNTAIFGLATGLSRVAGLVREIVASSYFGTSGAFSAFTIAFQVPNLIRSLFADAALSAAFVPVFTELLEQGRRRDAYRLASTLFLLILVILGAITVVFMLAAGVVMPLFTGTFSHQLDDLTVGLSRVLFPVVVLLGLNGLVVGILNALDHFSVPAIAPLVWNVVIIVALAALRPLFHGQAQLYAYAIGVLGGTIVQLALSLPMLPRLGFRFDWHFAPRDPRVKRVFALMLPVTIGLGVINFDVFLNQTLGALVSPQTPRAIDAAFRIYMLPQGIVSVALATVLFPALSRLAARRDIDGLRQTMASGVRQNILLLLPAAAFTAVLATPITRVIYQHGAFGAASTDQVSEALFWFAFSLPFAGVNLLYTRTFFSLQRPWFPTALAAGSLVVNGLLSVALYRPLGIAGPIIGTVGGSAVMAAAQAVYLRRELHGRLEGRRTALTAIAIVSATGALGVVAYATWAVLEWLLGSGLVGQVVAVAGAGAAGAAAYGRAVLWMRVDEAFRFRSLVAARLAR